MCFFFTDYRMRPDPSTSYPGRTHRFYTGEAVYKFGAGLSYTTFRSNLQLRALPTALIVLSGKPVDTIATTLSVSTTNTVRKTQQEALPLLQFSYKRERGMRFSTVFS